MCQYEANSGQGIKKQRKEASRPMHDRMLHKKQDTKMSIIVEPCQTNDPILYAPWHSRLLCTFTSIKRVKSRTRSYHGAGK